MIAFAINDCHAEALFSPERFVVLNAGRGFGKTPLSILKMLLHMKTPYHDAHGTPLPHNIWYIAPSYRQAKEIGWKRIKNAFKAQTKSKNETKMELVLTNGATIQLHGALNPDNLRGTYLTLAVFDEFAFHPPNYWQTVIKPMLVKTFPLGEAFFLSTPDGENEFYDLHQEGMLGLDNEFAAHTFTSVQGGFISAEEIERDKRLMTLDVWRQEYEAVFISGAGRVYYNFSKTKHLKATQWAKGRAVHWAFDFNEVPSVHSTLSHVANGKVFVYDEICTGNTPQIAEDFMRRYPPEHFFKNGSKYEPVPIYLYGDVSGNRNTSGVSDYQALVEILQTNGYPTPELRIHSTNPGVKNRTNVFNKMLENALGDVRLIMHHTNTPKLVKDLLLVKRKSNGDLDKSTDPTLTHVSDALGYQLAYLFSDEAKQAIITPRHWEPEFNPAKYWH